MKIIYGITKSNFGGAQRYVFDLAREARKRGHDVSVMCGGDGILVDKLKNAGIRIISIPHMGRDISLVDEFRSFHFIFRTLFEEKPDVFHTNSSKMGGLGNLAARLAGVRNIIFTGHGWAFNEPRPWWEKIAIKEIVWLTILLSRKTICVSEKSRQDVASLPFIRNKLTVVHNGVETFDLAEKEEARRTLGVPNNAFVIGTLAELHPVKGLDVLLFAWNKFNKKYPKVKLVICGAGDERDGLQLMAESLDIESSVDFAGYVENARRLLKAFDIFVLPSRSENMPYAVLEAGTAGLPVVATSVGGTPEIIDTSISGALVEPEDPEALFSTLVLLAQDAELRKRLGKNLRERVQKDFSIQKMAEKTFGAY